MSLEPGPGSGDPQAIPLSCYFCRYLPGLGRFTSPSACVFQALQSNLKYSLLPRRLIISKRLAQCLHPALPTGVHLKALETYEIIFKIVGTKWLAKDLFLYRYSSLPTILTLITQVIHNSVHTARKRRTSKTWWVCDTWPKLEPSSQLPCQCVLSTASPPAFGVAVPRDHVATSRHPHHQLEWLPGCF